MVDLPSADETERSTGPRGHQLLADLTKTPRSLLSYNWPRPAGLARRPTYCGLRRLDDRFYRRRLYRSMYISDPRTLCYLYTSLATAIIIQSCIVPFFRFNPHSIVANTVDIGSYEDCYSLDYDRCEDSTYMSDNLIKIKQRSAQQKSSILRPRAAVEARSK